MQLRRTLQSLALGHRENPRVVLLSPGPRSNTYFEDAYLARYLGYTLVEGGDLTVRNTSVFLKTLGGLLPVDVILRRVRDEDAIRWSCGRNRTWACRGWCKRPVAARW